MPKIVIGKKNMSEHGTAFLPQTAPHKKNSQEWVENSLLASGNGELAGVGEETLLDGVLSHVYLSVTHSFFIPSAFSRTKEVRESSAH